MLNAGIFIFDQVEVLDFAGPFEVFSVTSELNGYSLLKVFTISENGNLITTVNGLKVQPEYSFDNHPPVDILVIPGGIGTKKEMNNSKTLSWVKTNYKTAEIVFSVCTGARILGSLGLLDGIESITHHEAISELKEIAPDTRINQTKRFIDNGKIMSSGGISAGIDLSLHIIGKKFGDDVKKQTMKYMEYGAWEK